MILSHVPISSLQNPSELRRFKGSISAFEWLKSRRNINSLVCQNCTQKHIVHYIEYFNFAISSDEFERNKIVRKVEIEYKFHCFPLLCASEDKIRKMNIVLSIVAATWFLLRRRSWCFYWNVGTCLADTIRMNMMQSTICYIQTKCLLPGNQTGCPPKNDTLIRWSGHIKVCRRVSLVAIVVVEVMPND